MKKTENCFLRIEAGQAASETKSQFMARISHEIRTPMNAILGISELLLHEKLSQKQFKYVSDIKNSTMALLEIVNDIFCAFKLQIPKDTADETIGSEDLLICAPFARILVVDDNIVNLTVMIGLLELCNISAETAASGKQAIDLIRQNQYDIVLMDYMMPELNGIEATKIIRESGITTPIIAITATAITGAKEMMLEAGMDDYLPKPITMIELKNMLKKWIPADKLETPTSILMTSKEAEDEKYREFWKRIEQIEEISISTALERTDGKWDMLRMVLRLMIYEIEKSYANLSEFYSGEDMNNFRIEIHGMKGSLASIGAMELAAKAFNLESASEKNDINFCASNLPSFLEEMNNLHLKLIKAFSEIIPNGVHEEIPPELPPILEKLVSAFKEIDLALIDEGIKKLNALSLSGALEEEVELIKDAAVMMDYDKAVKQINRLLNDA